MQSILDHISLGVTDYDRAKQFYDHVLPTLGIALIWEKPNMASYGIGGDDQFGLQTDTDGRRGGNATRPASPPPVRQPPGPQAASSTHPRRQAR